MTGCRALRGKTLDLIRVFHVIHKHRLSSQLTFKRSTHRDRSHAVHHRRALLLECLRNNPGDALSVRDAEYEEGFPAELEKVAHRFHPKSTKPATLSRKPRDQEFKT